MAFIAKFVSLAMNLKKGKKKQGKQKAIPDKSLVGEPGNKASFPGKHLSRSLAMRPHSYTPSCSALPEGDLIPHLQAPTQLLPGNKRVPVKMIISLELLPDTGHA